MKVFDIAFKDLRRSFLSAFLLVFGFALPLLTAALFYFAFGGLASGDDGFDLPVTRVQIVNLDEAQRGISVGGTLVNALHNAIPGIIEVQEAPDAASARAAVDRQEAAVAVIIPPDLSAAVNDPQASSAIELYQDPTLTLGPSIVKGIVSGIVDGFAGSKIALQIANEQLAEQDLSLDVASQTKLTMQYGLWSFKLGAGFQGEENPLFDVLSPATGEKRDTGGIAAIIGQIMVGMMVFYVFFTGASAALSILQEEEAGTLPRLFTTPTPQSTILGGKFVAGFVLLTIQVVVLVLASTLIFDIYWGEPLPVALVTVGLIVLASSFGIFVASLLKDSRQAGFVYGGVLTMLGMVGMIGVFTASVPGLSDRLAIAALVTPHGWGVRGWQLAMKGGGVGDVLLTVGVMLAAGVAFFAIGVLRFRKRYA